jgi:hypothetical protein
VYLRFDSRRQLIYRIAHGLAKVVQFLSVHSPVEGFADISTGQPKLDVVLFIGQRVLVMCEHGTSRHRGEETYPDHGEKDTNGAKNGLWLARCSRAPLRDSGHRWPHSARREHRRAPSVARSYLSWPGHRVPAGEGCAVKAVRKNPSPNRDERPS